MNLILPLDQPNILNSVYKPGKVNPQNQCVPISPTVLEEMEHVAYKCPRSLWRTEMRRFEKQEAQTMEGKCV